ncbi:MAG TPA: DUF1553 domain-containing protein [Candidatus Limnocylindria bacterium]|nr:DUF1553 domain-containing protein [Candidatus Limnocylindria bacterium]
MHLLPLKLVLHFLVFQFSAFMMRRYLAIALAGLGFGVSHSVSGVDFSREIEPILSDKCYHCHGPSESGRKGGFRLDIQEGAAHTKSGKPAIVPGQSQKSELVRRILSTDPEVMMPPPESNRSLSPLQIQQLQKWVDEGAKWGLHWSFVAPRTITPPRPQKHKVSHPIDAFVAAKLETENLHLNPPADRARLLRRVSFDLTGLPPTLSELDAFQQDTSPNAYEKVVDRLLASSRFGERVAVDWLDLARYADTHGYQADRYRPMWPYRDWVIKSLNQNLPFDQFVTQQLAGDLLPNATRDQRLATAFNRLHVQNEEGGIVEEEFRVSYVVDRVNTFGTAFLGLTFECCRCHDHKYDPLSQRDFYQLFSFFQNIDESGQSVYFGDVMSVPSTPLTTDDQDRKLAELRENISLAEKELAEKTAQSGSRFDTWLAHRNTNSTLPGLVARYSFDELADGKYRNLVRTNYPGSPSDNPKSVGGKFGQALEFSGDNGVSFSGLGHFTRADSFSIGLWLKPASVQPRNVILHHSKAWMDAGSRGYEILLEDGHVSVGMHRMWPGNSLKVRTQAVLPTNAWSHVAFTYDGSSRAAGIKVYIDGRRAEVETIRDHLTLDFTYGGEEPDMALASRFRDSGFKGGCLDELQVYNRTLSPGEIAQVAGNPALEGALATPLTQLSQEPRKLLEGWYQATVDFDIGEARERLARARREENKLITSIPDIMVMEEMPQPKPAHIFKRGAYDSPGAEVTADTPHILPAFPKDQPRNRLGLAKWLLSPQHPLTARVTVNRFWQIFFGKGIVETTENFGLQGSQPSNADLLDWLAVTFSSGSKTIKNGDGKPLPPWDIKSLCRLIVTSETYKQSSKASPELLARDPDNRLLARGSSKRLTAEMLRDQALAASGLLVEKMGGPSVKPYQPDGLWEVSWGGHYDTGHGDDLHRRSLYTYWKRTTPPPAMVNFDAADRSYCLVRRQSTSTPLQALTLLNDVQITEAARFVSGRALREAGDKTSDRVRLVFRAITNRSPTEAELGVLTQLFDEQRGLFERDEGAAKKLLAVGETAADPTQPPNDLAAGTVVALALFNHDEAVMER